ncbi:hypothetical protein [Streptosporangium vulgare]|uniref:hypothetical protein n=1 Tax=Streptosporangium vulgare TaxID=46190 RepID=UPI0031D3CB66
MTCQLGVWAAEKGQVAKLRFWYIVSFLMGAVFVGGQLYEVHASWSTRAQRCRTSAYDSVFYLTTGFSRLHVTGGLIAFLFMAGTHVRREALHP